MFSKKLPIGSNDFRMSGSSGFVKKLANLTRHGQFSNLRNNRDQAIKIFQTLIPTIKRDGKIPFSTRQRAYRKFISLPGTTRDDERDFKKILDYYK